MKFTENNLSLTATARKYSSSILLLLPTLCPHFKLLPTDIVLNNEFINIEIILYL